MKVPTRKHFTDRPVYASQSNQNNGYILLISVIILGAITVTIAVTLLTIGLTASQTSFTQAQEAEAKAVANACAERALERIRNASYNNDPVADDILSFPGKSCSYTVLSATSPPTTIQATGKVGSVTSRVKVEIDVIDPVINIKSWREVAVF